MIEHELWRAAESLQDLGALAARWLEGDIAFQPGYGGSAPDEETASLVDVLAKVNQAGSDAVRLQYNEELGQKACEALGVAWQLHIFDPVWGRNDRLWPSLEQALVGQGNS